MSESLADRILQCRVEMRLMMRRMRREQGREESIAMNQAEFGALVAHELGRTKAISGATVSRWEAGKIAPDLDSILAIAKLSYVDPGWLAFGDKSEAPTPAGRFSRDPIEARMHQIEVDSEMTVEKIRTQQRGRSTSELLSEIQERLDTNDG